MTRTLAALTALVLGALACGCSSTAAPKDEHAIDWEVLKSSMMGRFSSRDQSKADPGNYQDVRLVMTQIWPTRDDGLWLYVEQAVATDTARPYRQRVYRLVPETNGSFRTTVFNLPGDPLRFSDGTGAPHGLEALSIEDLSPRSGCDLVLRTQPNGSFAGGTEGKDCPNELKGAKYSTSAVKISPNTIVAWDRGFDAQGKQVWGATKGGYVFKRERSGVAPAGRAR
jgi:hypothetical protein